MEGREAVRVARALENIDKTLQNLLEILLMNPDLVAPSTKVRNGIGRVVGMVPEKEE
jgi:hypothetical protein